jgi:hypothetical protein
MNPQDFADTFKELLEKTVRETATELKVGAAELALYASERAAHLSSIVGQPGFNAAVQAERDNVAIKGAIKLQDQATRADERFLGLIHGALAFGASALA